VTYSAVAESVGGFLGIPFEFGLLIRFGCLALLGKAFKCFIPLILYFLITWFGTLYLMRFLSAEFYKKEKGVQKNEETDPLLGECEKSSQVGTWKKFCSASYQDTVTTETFTAVSNNFQLNLAIAIPIYGSGSIIEAIHCSYVWPPDRSSCSLDFDYSCKVV
jgi:ACR3 family arsenite transporter